MNVESGTEAAQLLFWKYLFPIFGIMSLQCYVLLDKQPEKQLHLFVIAS
jgi:hypothetical protein